MRTLQSIIADGISKYLEENGYATSFSPNLLSQEVQADLAKYIAKEVSIYLGREYN
jgi:SMC interacting uncharacterized protein involved in chromosome segregation